MFDEKSSSLVETDLFFNHFHCSCMPHLKNYSISQLLNSFQCCYVETLLFYSSLPWLCTQSVHILEYAPSLCVCARSGRCVYVYIHVHRILNSSRELDFLVRKHSFGNFPMISIWENIFSVRQVIPEIFSPYFYYYSLGTAIASI